MFRRLHKQKSSDRSGERKRFDIQLSGFQALQIPKGWDRLALSFVSVETGKTVNKTARAVVWNGNCQWTETVSEPVWMTRGDTSKDAEGCLFKIVVTSGSSRSNVLGEASINLASYVEASASVPVSLQLSKCSYGTILQMRARCLTSKHKLGDDQVGTDLNSSFEELAIEYEELDGSENMSIGLPRPPLRKSNSKDTSFSASGSGSGGSFDSCEGTISDKDNGCNYSGGRQNSSGSRGSSVNGDGIVTFDECVKSNSPSFSSKQRGSGPSFLNQNGELRWSLQSSTASPLHNAGSSKEHLIEAVEVAVEELRVEARMWERNARKLMSDTDTLREELSQQSEQPELLRSELSASREECNSLRLENERVNAILLDLTKKQTAEEENAEEFRKALEEEIKFQKQSNADLASQLKKTQDSNVELLSVLQEFEETIDEQKAEIDTLLSAKQVEGSKLDSRISDLEDEIREKETRVFSEAAALKLQLVRSKELTEMLVLNYALAHLDSTLHVLEISQNDRDESSVEHSRNRMAGKCSEVDDIRGAGDDSLKGEEIEALKSRIEELEDQIGSFEDKKTPTPVDNLDESSVSVDKFLVTTTKLDTYNNDLEVRLSELEEENVWLSERIIGLEAQLRHLTNEKESTLLSLQNSDSLCSKLKKDIRKMESDLEVMDIDMKQKLLALQERSSQSLEERSRLKVENSNLGDDCEVLTQKCIFLEKANEGLKKENRELHEECSVLEAEVGELKELFLRLSTGIDSLEENMSSLVEETALKEKALRSEVDSLLRENTEESIRSVDVAISEHNEEVLMADREKLLDLLEDVKSNEKRLKSIVRRLGLSLKGTECDNLRLVRETKAFELRLQQTEALQKEVSSLRRGIREAFFEKERLEASNQVLLEQYEETKSERDSLVRKFSSIQCALTEVEHSRNTKAALEDKILRLEGDLTAREAVFAHDAKQKNELARAMISNRELHRRIKCLQDCSEVCTGRSTKGGAATDEAPSNTLID